MSLLPKFQWCRSFLRPVLYDYRQKMYDSLLIFVISVTFFLFDFPSYNMLTGSIEHFAVINQRKMTETDFSFIIHCWLVFPSSLQQNSPSIFLIYLTYEKFFTIKYSAYLRIILIRLKISVFPFSWPTHKIFYAEWSNKAAYGPQSISLLPQTYSYDPLIK